MVSIDQPEGSDEPIKRGPPARDTARDTWGSIRRGMRGLCPACGEGRVLHSYLKVNDACASCGEELHHQRADDFPPYLTIFVVGHILGGAMFAVDETWPDLPMTFHFILWPVACIVLLLWLLPIFKGGLIAYQWALRMHGFETAHQSIPQAMAEQASPSALHRSAA